VSAGKSYLYQVRAQKIYDNFEHYGGFEYFFTKKLKGSQGPVIVNKVSLIKNGILCTLSLPSKPVFKTILGHRIIVNYLCATLIEIWLPPARKSLLIIEVVVYVILCVCSVYQCGGLGWEGKLVSGCHFNQVFVRHRKNRLTKPVAPNLA